MRPCRDTATERAPASAGVPAVWIMDRLPLRASASIGTGCSGEVAVVDACGVVVRKEDGDLAAADVGAAIVAVRRGCLGGHVESHVGVGRAGNEDQRALR